MDKKKVFYSVFGDMVYKLYYWDLYKDHITKCDKYIGFFVAIVTSSSVSAWFIWDSLSWLWMMITIIAQIVGIAYPRMKYSVKAYALNHALPIMERIKIEMERDYIFIDDTSEAELHEKFHEYETRYSDCYNKYLLSLDLISIDRFCTKATHMREEYFTSRYPEYVYMKEEEHMPEDTRKIIHIPKEPDTGGKRGLVPPAKKSTPQPPRPTSPEIPSKDKK
ncbi:MAG: hypothetical protein ACK5LX_01190 [Oscillospiraceae bacterium]